MTASKETKGPSTVFRDDLFRGKVVLVSGGATGLGKASAEQFARLGASVVICGRDAARLEETATELRAFGATVMTRAMTIRDPEQVAGLMDEVWQKFGRLDVLVNNAGGQFAQPAIDISPKGWLAVVDTNLNGTWFMMQAAAQRWREHGQPGNIINVVVVIWRGLPQIAHSCAARAGIVYASKTVAVEWAPLNIRVNCVAPGTIATDAFDQYTDAGRASFEQANPMLHAGDSSDIADAIAYLASDASKFITGEVLTVDGGQQCWGDAWFSGRPPYFELDYEASREVPSARHKGAPKK
jgi:citronellol/citronellal dehydrogenase